MEYDWFYCPYIEKPGSQYSSQLIFTPIVNAAHTIGQQINGIISQFISNIYMSTRPQITKYYAVGQKEKCGVWF